MLNKLAKYLLTASSVAPVFFTGDAANLLI